MDSDQAVRPSLFEFAGGEPAFLRLAAAHHQLCLDDPVLNHPFSHPGHPQHVERLGRYWAEVLGGPAVYSTECGTQSSMLDIHCGNGGEDELGSRFVLCFVQAMDDAGLPDDAEFRRVMTSYMEWAVYDVLAYAPFEATVTSGLPVPHWGWDGLIPG